MEKNDLIFSDEGVMLVFTTSPAGLGHVRVTEALRKGIPSEVRSEIVGVSDSSIKLFHRLTSRNRLLRTIMESVQNNPFFEEGFTIRYRKYLTSHSSEMEGRLKNLIGRQRPHPSVVVVISTHFSLAHQIAAVKNQLAKDYSTCIILAVVVTDDSPQNIWGVFNSDFIFVPSASTKESLERYMLTISGKIPEIIVSPYPISAIFSKRLEPEEYRVRLEQLQPNSKTKMQVMLPVSGAAVQLNYFQELLSVIGYGGFSDISVVSRDSSYTNDFISWCQKQPSIRVTADLLDRDVVLEYERQYEKEIFAIEVTKPSEQLFKVLVTPKRRGGVIMLFSDPVGRQEDDNLVFLLRHRLLPYPEEQRWLWKSRVTAEELKAKGIFEKARSWRGLRLPSNGYEAGQYIVRMRNLDVLSAMANFSGYMAHPELKGSGVKQFWEILSSKVQTKCSF
jgi:hypothetical protein